MMKPTIQFDRPLADAAYEAHVALIELEHREPKLASNKFFQALRDSAYARFRAAFEAGQ